MNFHCISYNLDMQNCTRCLIFWRDFLLLMLHANHNCFFFKFWLKLLCSLTFVPYKLVFVQFLFISYCVHVLCLEFHWRTFQLGNLIGPADSFPLGTWFYTNGLVCPLTIRFMGWSKSSLVFFHKIVWKNPNKLFDQPNILL